MRLASKAFTVTFFPDPVGCPELLCPDVVVPLPTTPPEDSAFFSGSVETSRGTGVILRRGTLRVRGFPDAAAEVDPDSCETLLAWLPPVWDWTSIADGIGP